MYKKLQVYLSHLFVVVFCCVVSTHTTWAQKNSSTKGIESLDPETKDVVIAKLLLLLRIYRVGEPNDLDEQTKELVKLSRHSDMFLEYCEWLTNTTIDNESIDCEEIITPPMLSGIPLNKFTFEYQQFIREWHQDITREVRNSFRKKVKERMDDANIIPLSELPHLKALLYVWKGVRCGCPEVLDGLKNPGIEAPNGKN